MITVKTHLNADQIAPAVRKLSRKRVLVGIPDTNDARSDGAIGNATIGYINEFGSPLQKIPPRPHLVPGVQDALKQIENHFKQAMLAALEGKNEDINLRNAGQVAVNSVHRTIQAGLKPPLSQVTVDRRRQRSKGSKYRRKAITSADTTPLIDTGTYLRNIVYVLRNR